MAAYGRGQTLGSGINPESFKQDFSGFARAAQMQAQGIANLGQSIGQATGDYFKQQNEKKKAIKQASTQIESALNLFPDLKSTFGDVQNRLRDDDIPLSERAAEAETIAGLINMGVSKLRDDSTTLQNQQKLQLDAAYKGRQLKIAQQKADAAAATALAAGQAPPKTVSIAVEGGDQLFQWSPDVKKFVPVEVGGMEAPPQAAIGNNIIDIVKRFEGFRPQAYNDYGQTSVGYGTRGQAGEVLSEQQATERLQSELAGHAKRIQDAAEAKGVSLNENQFNALTSFDYNTGKGADLLQRFGDKPEELAAKMLEYTKAGGEELPGLVNRRRIEAALFLSPDAQTTAAKPRVGFKPDKPEKTGKVVSLDELKQLSDEGIKFNATSNPDGSFTLTDISPANVAEDARARDIRLNAEAFDLYSKGDRKGALNILRTLKARDIYGDITDETLDDYFKQIASESPAPAPTGVDPSNRPPLSPIAPRQ